MQHASAKTHVTFAALSLSLLCGVAIALTGCGPKKVERAPAAAPAPTFSGPPFLRNTIGSLCTLSGFTPQYVEGVGIVVNLNGTGSPQVPAPLRAQLENELRKRGVGNIHSTDSGFPRVSPGQLLDDDNTAIVSVQGLIPPGATRNTRFDILVSAWDQTQTTSLQGGTLMPCDLSPLGAVSPGTYLPTQAEAGGDIYQNPFDDQNVDVEDLAFMRQGIVLRGGRVTEDQRLELRLNQPSWARSRTIANRINERFGRTQDRRAIAEPRSDRVIAINVPPRFADNPSLLIDLISYVYLGGGPGFETAMAQRLVEVARNRPDDRTDVSMALKALGKTVIPTIRPLYEAEDLGIAFTALTAGAFLGDQLATVRLSSLSTDPDPRIRVQVALILSDLPRSDKGSSALFRLADDPVEEVRITAYEALIATGDPLVSRLPILDENGRIKYVVDRVYTEEPFVYARISQTPTVAVFGREIPLGHSEVARAWGNRLMVRTSQPPSPWEVFYAPREAAEPKTFYIEPDYATLAYFLGHHPSVSDLQPGLDLTYSRVVDILYEFSNRDYFDTPMRFEVSGLAAAIGVYEEEAEQANTPRREASDPEADDADNPTDQDAPAPSDASDLTLAERAFGTSADDAPAPNQLNNDAFPRAPARGRAESSN
ncbi:MAG: flagellar basal body P-ring protein FlgI [Planctomycetota bacterium]